MYIPNVALWLPSILQSAQQPLPEVDAANQLDASSSASIIVPHRQPAFAEPIDPHLVAFSIEADRWPDWAGYEVGKPNEFAKQVFANLQDRGGAPPAIRVGADSEDRTHLDLSLAVGHAIYPPATPSFPYPEAERISVGRDWYKLSHNLAPGTPLTWGLNLKSLNISETVAQAHHLSQAFPIEHAHGLDDEAVSKHGHSHSSVKLDAVEIGNEPELYTRSRSGGGVGNPGDWSKWTVKNYTSTWTKYAKEVGKALDIQKRAKSGGTVLRIGEIQFAGSASGWAPQSIFQAGLLDDEFNRKHVKVYSEHMYQANFDVGHEAASGVLMDKWNVRGNLSRRALDVVACRREGISFVLGETSTYSSHGSPGTSNVAESALFSIDYLLQAASMGVSRVYLSQGVGYRYSAFQPISGIKDDGRDIERAHIMPLYYGLLFVNEAIGPISKHDKHEHHVAELGTVHPNIVSYGIYAKKRLVKVVIVNTQVHAEGDGDDRKEVKVELDGLNKVRVMRLRVPFTSAPKGLTWAGQDFDTEDAKATGKVEVEEAEGSVTLEASSAVLVYV